MFRLLLTALILMAVPTAANAEAQNYEFDKKHTMIMFNVGHMGLSHSWGKFLDFDGDIKIHLRQNTFGRCLNNLINNGLSYGEKVEITTKKTIGDLIIFIDDDGPGIPQEEYEKVMKPFYRIDKSRGQNKSGVGLGLSIANDIVRSHGGNILLEKSPLNGLRVKISLPF